jgi:hypothetical protein
MKFSKRELELIKGIVEDRISLAELMIKDSVRQGVNNNDKTKSIVSEFEGILKKIEKYESEMD